MKKEKVAKVADREEIEAAKEFLVTGLKTNNLDMVKKIIKSGYPINEPVWDHSN